MKIEGEWSGPQFVGKKSII